MGIIILTIVLYYLAKNVGFDADMMKNNYMSEELKQVEERVNSVTNLSKKTVYVISIGSDIEGAMENNSTTTELINNLIDEGTIQNAATISNILSIH